MTDEILQQANTLHERLYKLTTAHHALAGILNEANTQIGAKKAKLAGIFDILPDEVFEQLLPEIGEIIKPLIAEKIQSAQKEFVAL